MSNLAIDIGNKVIRDIREYCCEDAIIAGGWARDQLFDNVIKDVDIWLTEVIHKQDLLDLFPNLTGYQYFDHDIDTRLVCVSKFNIEGVSVDLITIKPEFHTPDNNAVCTFDFGICQAWSIGDGLIHGTPMFWNDYYNSRITYNNTEYNNNNLKRIIEVHLPRLKVKFNRSFVKGLPKYEVEKKPPKVTFGKPIGNLNPAQMIGRPKKERQPSMVN